MVMVVAICYLSATYMANIQNKESNVKDISSSVRVNQEKELQWLYLGIK
jgi:hypothetical protein